MKTKIIQCKPHELEAQLQQFLNSQPSLEVLNYSQSVYTESVCTNPHPVVLCTLLYRD